MIYKCEKCLKEFDQKCHYNYHIRRKISCINKKNDKNINSIIEEDNILPNVAKMAINPLPNIAILVNSISKFKCNVCDNNYKHYSSLYKHKQIKHPRYEDEINELTQLKTEINELKVQNNEINQLKNQIEELKKIIITNPITNPITNNNNNNTTNNGTIHNTINIIKFGSKMVEDLNKDEIKNILFGRNVDPIMAIIESTHFNNRLPSQQNIKYTNINSKYADIHNGSKWNKENVNNVVDNLLENHTSNLCELSNRLDNSHRINKSVKNIINEYSTNTHLDSDERKVKSNKKVVKNISEKKEEIKLFIHNKSV